jgi:hypothetical protein
MILLPLILPAAQMKMNRKMGRARVRAKLMRKSLSDPGKSKRAAMRDTTYMPARRMTPARAAILFREKDFFSSFFL